MKYHRTEDWTKAQLLFKNHVYAVSGWHYAAVQYLKWSPIPASLLSNVLWKLKLQVNVEKTKFIIVGKG